MASLRDIRRTLAWLAAVAALVFISAHVEAECRCVPPGAPKYELDRSVAVFSGKVISIKKGSGMTQRVTFNVLKTWKGRKKKQIVITNSTDPAGCGYEFKKNQKYLVYALWGEGGHLTTSVCSRTAPLELSDKDIEEFNNNGITARHPAKN